MPDGSHIVLKKLAEDYDPTDRDARVRRRSREARARAASWSPGCSTWTREPQPFDDELRHGRRAAGARCRSSACARRRPCSTASWSSCAPARGWRRRKAGGERRSRVRAGAAVDAGTPGLNTARRSGRRRQTTAPIVNVGVGHGARRTTRRPHPAVPVRMRAAPSLPAAAAAGLAALPGAGRPLRDAGARARGALRADARSTARGGAPRGGPVSRLRLAGARVRAGALRDVPGRVPGGVSVQGAALLPVVPRAASWRSGARGWTSTCWRRWRTGRWC